jgi:phage terminase large subunit-like protein
MKRTSLLIAALGLLLFVQAARAGWSPTKRLTWTSGSSYYPAIAIDSNNHIHVVWYDDTPGNAEIYYKNSTNGGTSWSVGKRLTWTSGDSQGPAVAIDSNNEIHVVWYDETPGNTEIYYKRTTGGGTAWSASKRLTWNFGNSLFPTIGIDGDQSVYVVWHDYIADNYEIYYKKSTDGGTTWSPIKRLTWTSGHSFFPAIGIDSVNGIHVVWHDASPGNNEIYYKKSTDGGASWSPAKRLTWTSSDSTNPAIAINTKNYVHVVWQDNLPGQTEIYFRRSTDTGVNWNAAKRLTWTSDHSQNPAMAVDKNGTIHIAWQDLTPGPWQIYYKKSTDGGTTWSPLENLTGTPNVAGFPAIATDANNAIHVVWTEFVDDNNEIYYRKGN